MDLTRFEKFREGLAAHLPGAVSQILGKEKGSDFCEIGFITTDDLYGCFITWDTSGCIDEYFDWDQQLEPEEYRKLTAALARRGYSFEMIRKVTAQMY